jgi:uncharacterized protein YbcV (DUF1398 family)
MKWHQVGFLFSITSLVVACNSTNRLITKNQKQMFTTEQIRSTLSEARTGADFPRIAVKLKNLGVTHYETSMEDGQSVFYGSGKYEVHTGANYAALTVAGAVNTGQLKSDIKNHQAGKSDYFQISRQSADNGIAKWAVNLEQMTCSYLDKSGAPVWVEHIPTTSYDQVPFTMAQIKAAHAKVKSGADFPAYVQEMKVLGVRSYQHYVSDGHINYHGSNGFTLLADAKWPPVDVASRGKEDALKHALSIHQAGQTDYLAFCRQAAEAGVAYWTVDMQQMNCTYYDKAGRTMLTEYIPAP